MAKYHIHPETGAPGKCAAKNGKCPFGSDESHFNTLAEAKKESEKRLAAEHGALSTVTAKSPHETLAEATAKNAKMRELLNELPSDVAKKVTGGYIDLADEIELSPEYKKSVDEFSTASDEKYARLINALQENSHTKAADQSATLAYLEKAAESGNDGYRNEYMLAATLAQYEGIKVYFPDAKTSQGGSPKVDLIVEVNGELHTVSVKKNNGTQIEAHAKRSTVAEIIPGEKVISKIEAISNRIFFFRPKFQAHGMKPGQPEKLRVARGEKPKWAGTSVRMEYGYESSMPKDRPTLPDEVALEAFGGIRQQDSINYSDHNGVNVGTLPSSAARILVAGDFSKMKNLENAPLPKDILAKATPISRKGINEAGIKVTVRVSSIGDREGDWITDRSHVTDTPGLTKAKLEKAIASYE